MLGRPLAWPWLPILSLPLALLCLAGFLATLPLLPFAELAAAGRARRGRRRPAVALTRAGPGSAWLRRRQPRARPAAEPDRAGHPLGRRDLGRRPGGRRLALGRPPAGRCRRCRNGAVGSPGPGRLARDGARPPAPADRRARVCGRARGRAEAASSRAPPARAKRRGGGRSRASRPGPPADARHGGAGRAAAVAAGPESASPARPSIRCRRYPIPASSCPASTCWRPSSR